MTTSWIRRAACAAATAITGALIIVFSSGIRFREAPWTQNSELLLLGSALAAAFLPGAIILNSRILWPEGILQRAFRAIVIASAACVPVFLLMRLGDVDLQNIKKLTLLIEVAMVYLLCLLNGVGIPWRFAFPLNLAVLAFAIAPSFSAPARVSLQALLEERSAEKTTQIGEAEFVFTTLHDLKVLTAQAIPEELSLGLSYTGGAFESVGRNKLLLVDITGRFFLLSLEQDKLQSTLLEQIASPNNRNEYRAETTNPSNHFRVTDMKFQDEGRPGKRTVFVAHHQWHNKERCTTLNISSGEVDLENLNQPIDWESGYETAPCIPEEDTFDNATGGRISIRSPHSLLLTVGVTLGRSDHEWASDPDVAYGKIIEIDPTDWSSKVFSTGHRNPQGLLVDGDQIWSTEHGPAGGDELNLVVEGKDYGWPESSYGVDYGKKTRAEGGVPGVHSTGEQPTYAWVPSIGVSRLLRLKGKGFSSWRGDLLVGSLSGRGNGLAIHRVRFHNGLIKTVERIPIGKRVRDLIELGDGRIVTWDGSDIVQILSPASHVFSGCISCHVVNKGWVANGIGPDLYGIVGAEVAKVPDYSYSQAMQQFGGRWSKERLDWFLRDPQASVPGTAMVFPGVKDDAKRKAIISYLEKLGSD